MKNLQAQCFSHHSCFLTRTYST